MKINPKSGQNKVYKLLSSSVCMERRFEGYDYTMPISEFEKRRPAIYRAIGKESIYVLDTLRSGRVKIRVKGSDTMPTGQILDDLLRLELKIEGIRRVPYFCLPYNYN